MSKGYLIPENAQPADNRCLRVFVPDDPLYIAAFLGALTYFGQWTAWERDKEKRGQFAARAWQDANELTIDGLSLACGDYPLTEDEMSDILDKLDEISERLKELEDMDVIVNQTVNGCGCGCDSDSEPFDISNQLDGIILDSEDTGVIPKYDKAAKTESHRTRCRAANWFAAEVVSITRNIERIGTMHLTVKQWYLLLVELFTFDDKLIWSGTALIALSYRMLNVLLPEYYGIFGKVADKMESDMESLICSLYDWTSAEELGEKLNDAIMVFVDRATQELGLDGTVASTVYNALIDVIGAAYVNYLVENIVTIVPDGFVSQYSCSCGEYASTCPDAINIVTRGYYDHFPEGDLTGLTIPFTARFNATTGQYELIFEMAKNYCVTIENSGSLTITEAHQVCTEGVMGGWNGSCLRRYAAYSQAPFGTAVTFLSQSVDCDCTIPAEATGCKNYGNSYEGEFLSMTSFLTYAEDDYVLMKPDSTVGDPTGVFVDVGYGDILLRELRLNLAKGTDPDDASILRLTVASRDELVSEFVLDIPIASLSAITPSWKIIEFDSFPIAMHPSTGDVDIRFDFLPGTGRARIHEICLDYDMA